MNRYFELKSATAGVSRMLQLQLNKLIQMPISWLEWGKEVLEAGLFPDISSINAIDMPTFDFTNAANRCSSPCIDAWCGRGSLVGVPAMPMYFSPLDLYTITAGAVRSTLPHAIQESRHFFTKKFGYSTIPSGLSAS